MERIFQLAVPGGFTGQITANSFMKREFGKKLIEEFFPKVDLTHVIDTSGAYIPGHGTPTVILFGRNRAPMAKVIRTVMGIRGEPSTPKDAAKGLVWSAIVRQVDLEGAQSEFVSVADSQRELFHRHPWSIGGGGASELKELLDSLANKTLNDIATEIGFMVITGEDNCLTAPRFSMRRFPDLQVLPFGHGEAIRDWVCIPTWEVLWPNGLDAKPLDTEQIQGHINYLWPYRETLKNRRAFGVPVEEKGIPWWAIREVYIDKIKTSLSIAFAFVASHNHFVLDRGGKVFKQSAPVIKLPAGATEDEHLALLGLLNSSTACFWGRQTFFPKGGFADGKWEERLEWDGTKLQQFPLPAERPLKLTQKLDELAQNLFTFLPEQVLANWYSSNTLLLHECLEKSHANWITTRAKMIALQEELDWQCYHLYNLLDENLTYNGELLLVQLGQRSFEIVMARQMAAGELTTTWFDRHNSTPITELPADWPDDYKQLVERRIQLIETNKNIALIEQPEYKRRWNTEPWESQLQRALETWLLNHLESYFDFDGRMNDQGIPTAKIPDPALISTAKLADFARQDPAFLQVGELYRNDPAFDVQQLIDELVAKASVPLLPVLRYKDSGLRKRQAWEHTWTLQRQEDAIDARTQLPKDDPNYLDPATAQRLKAQEIGPIPVPPKYTTADFQKPHYWSLRGKLDVPKERWVSFPHCEGSDGLPVIAWAGYNHLQLAQAISAYYVQVQEQFGGSDDPRLVPLRSGLLELLPWLQQWHNHLDPEYGLQMGDYYAGFIQEESRRLGLTPEDLRNWEPPKTKSKGRKKR